MPLHHALHGGRWPAIAAALLLAALAPAAAPALAADAPFAAFHRWSAPAAAPVRAALPAARLGGSSWSHLPTQYSNGRTQCVGLSNSGLGLSVGSDEAGYWTTGSPFDPGYDWTAHGDELGGGVTQIMERFLIVGPNTVTRTCVTSVRGGGPPRLRTSDDDGFTWTTSTFDSPFQVQRVKRMLADGNFGNVGYLLAYGYDSVRDSEGWLLARTFDGGATWGELRFRDDVNDMDLWVTRSAPSALKLATDDYADVMVEASTDLGDTFEEQHVFSGWGDQGSPGIWITAADADLSKVWLLSGPTLLSWDGGSEELLQELESPVPATLCAGIGTTEFVMWADGQDVHWSSNGGVSSQILPNTDWSWDASHINNTPVRIECLAPFVFPAEAGGLRGAQRADARGLIPIQRFYISTGAGTYVYAAGDANAQHLSDDTMQNHQVHDLATVTDVNVYDFEVGLRDLGWTIVRSGSLPWFSAGGVGTYPNDAVVVATNDLPLGGDPFRLTQFRSLSGVLLGQGEFAVVSPPRTFAPDRVHGLIADPTVARRWHWCDDGVTRIDYDPLTDTFTQTPGSPTGFGGVYGLGISRSNPLVRYAAVVGFSFNGTILRTTDGGANWGTVSSVGPHAADDGTGVSAQVRFLVDPTVPTRAFAAGSTVMATSNGTTWTDIAASLPSGTVVYDLEFQTGDVSRVWAATSHGVFRWDGSVWEDMTVAFAGVPDVPFRAVIADPQQGVMRAGSFGRGIYEFDLGSSVAVGDDASRPALALSVQRQGLAGRARLEFVLPQAGTHALELLDVSGRRVALLSQGERAAGRHAVDVEAPAGSAGVYFARLRTPAGERHAKLVLAQ